VLEQAERGLVTSEQYGFSTPTATSRVMHGAARGTLRGSKLAFVNKRRKLRLRIKPEQ
jgi:hypothetical protein